MTLLSRKFAISAIAALAFGGNTALAQSAYDDAACRQYADAQTAPMRAQATNQAVGNTLLGAGVGAAIGGAVGGGRGAGIGAASGAVLGTMGGAANAQNANDYIAQQYSAYYYSCMQARSGPPAAAPAYQPAPAYPYTPASRY